MISRLSLLRHPHRSCVLQCIFCFLDSERSIPCLALAELLSSNRGSLSIPDDVYGLNWDCSIGLNHCEESNG
ncbi:hypothetical protein BU16DRAFT_200939 [Lophium mytilinum]|uniref:Uncharacterized protein n=1 Tax=Lophium mytilinum TaxID=390894 RepID=A0A6A6R9Y7_9PEZI|nr:hypothetical protein BU16DRAFT_200939 [Lophium mytilinum]